MFLGVIITFLTQRSTFIYLIAGIPVLYMFVSLQLPALYLEHKRCSLDVC